MWSAEEVHVFDERRQNTGAIAGGTIGGFFALLFLLTLVGLIAVITACKLKNGGGSGGGGRSTRSVSSPKSEAAKSPNTPASIPAIGQQNDLYGSPDE
jgi:hypothetical protein